MTNNNNDCNNLSIPYCNKPAIIYSQDKLLSGDNKLTQNMRYSLNIKNTTYKTIYEGVIKNINVSNITESSIDISFSVPGNPQYIMILVTNINTLDLLSYIIMPVQFGQPTTLSGLTNNTNYSFIATTTYLNNHIYTTNTKVLFSTN